MFDRWGCAELYRNNHGKLERIDSFAISEARDEDFAFGFGDLSIHEFATDGNEPVADSSYHSGGLRVVRFGPQGLDESAASSTRAAITSRRRMRRAQGT